MLELALEGGTAISTLRARFEELLSEILDATLAVYGRRLVSLAVFGSVGRGTPRPDSDIDILLVADDLPTGRMRRMAEFTPVEEALTHHLEQLRKQGIETTLSPVFKSREEIYRGSLLFLDMVDDARLMYDDQRFLHNYLERLRRRLTVLGAERIRRGGAWYWLLKKDYKVGEVFEI